MMGPDVGLTKYTRGQDSESAGTVSETPGETALVILRSTGGNAERALSGAWGTPAEFNCTIASPLWNEPQPCRCQLTILRNLDRQRQKLHQLH